MTKNRIYAALFTALTGLSVTTLPALAHQTDDMLVRIGATTVAPQDNSSNMFLAGGDLGFGVSVDNNTQLGLNFAYFITDRWNIEVLAATPFSHEVSVNTNPLGLGKLADVKHLPPTVTANYYFADTSSKLQPYAGVGLNYTVFFDENLTAENQEIGFSDLKLDNSFGFAGQIGADYQLDNGWFINGSVRYIAIDTKATFTLNNPTLAANNASGSVSVDIDPIVYTLSIGMKL